MAPLKTAPFKNTQAKGVMTLAAWCTSQMCGLDPRRVDDGPGAVFKGGVQYWSENRFWARGPKPKTAFYS